MGAVFLTSLKIAIYNRGFIQGNEGGMSERGNQTPLPTTYIPFFIRTKGLIMEKHLKIS